MFSEGYLNSPHCRHEMDRAVALDPGFSAGIVLPIRRDDCDLPDAISTPNPLYADLRNDQQTAPWALLLRQCGAELGADAPTWLAAKNKLQRFLDRGQSVSLVTLGRVAWRGLLEQLDSDLGTGLAIVDLENPGTASRRGLLSEVLAALGHPRELPDPPEDLVSFNRLLATPTRCLALAHFDAVADREDYGVDLFRTLRHLIEKRRLVLLTVSRSPFATLLPRDHPLSEVDLRVVTLREAR